MNETNKLIVVDLECTCVNEESTDQEKESYAAYGPEIIEIGYAILDTRKLETVDYDSVLVKPIGVISTFCTNLTGHSYDSLKGSHGLDIALRTLNNKLHLKHKLWGSWSMSDRLQLRDECVSKNIECPFGHRHINLKTMFAVIMGLKRECGLQKALRILQVPFIGTPHRGKDDALNTVSILIIIMKGRGK